MGVIPERFARRVGPNVVIVDSDPSVNRPQVTMYGGGNYKIQLPAAAYVQFDSGGTNFFYASYAANVTTIEGGGVTGDDLVLKANTIDTYPYIKNAGAGNIDIVAQDRTLFYAQSNLIADINLAGTGGCLTLKEGTTPTALTDYGKLYTKNDNELYYQTGAGVEKTVTTV